jgi:NAD(P)-dependent dehydrogenase (short-subunit alcohol dehydrogenase family)
MSETKNAGRLQGRVALVSGASRGIGRGIAHELGLAGATVYVTGRTRHAGEAPEGLPGTIDETAHLVTSAGGEGIAVACDHTQDEAVARLAETVRERHGGLDLLVNNLWGGYEDYDAKLFEPPPWEQPLWRWDKMMATGVRAHYVTTRALLPLMLGRERALIAFISAGDEGRFLGDVQYDVAKAAVDRLGFALGRKLRRHAITTVTVHPGLTRTERVERHAAAEELRGAHSARFVGRGLVALASDPDVSRHTGRVFKAARLGLDYGFQDVDGSQPEPFVLPELD